MVIADITVMKNTQTNFFDKKVNFLLNQRKQDVIISTGILYNQNVYNFRLLIIKPNIISCQVYFTSVQLDLNLVTYLINHRSFLQKLCCHLSIMFCNKTAPFPEWLRQYSSHIMTPSPFIIPSITFNSPVFIQLQTTTFPPPNISV